MSLKEGMKHEALNTMTSYQKKLKDGTKHAKKTSYQESHEELMERIDDVCGKGKEPKKKGVSICYPPKTEIQSGKTATVTIRGQFRQWATNNKMTIVMLVLWVLALVCSTVFARTNLSVLFLIIEMSVIVQRPEWQLFLPILCLHYSFVFQESIIVTLLRALVAAMVPRNPELKTYIQLICLVFAYTRWEEIRNGLFAWLGNTSMSQQLEPWFEWLTPVQQEMEQHLRQHIGVVVGFGFIATMLAFFLLQDLHTALSVKQDKKGQWRVHASAIMLVGCIVFAGAKLGAMEQINHAACGLPVCVDGQTNTLNVTFIRVNDPQSTEERRNTSAMASMLITFGKWCKSSFHAVLTIEIAANLLGHLSTAPCKGNVVVCYMLSFSWTAFWNFLNFVFRFSSIVDRSIWIVSWRKYLTERTVYLTISGIVLQGYQGFVIIITLLNPCLLHVFAWVTPCLFKAADSKVSGWLDKQLTKWGWSDTEEEKTAEDSEDSGVSSDESDEEGERARRGRRKGGRRLVGRSKAKAKKKSTPESKACKAFKEERDRVNREIIQPFFWGCIRMFSQEVLYDTMVHNPVMQHASIPWVLYSSVIAFAVYTRKAQPKGYLHGLLACFYVFCMVGELKAKHATNVQRLTKLEGEDKRQGSTGFGHEGARGSQQQQQGEDKRQGSTGFGHEGARGSQQQQQRRGERFDDTCAGGYYGPERQPICDAHRNASSSGQQAGENGFDGQGSDAHRNASSSGQQAEGQKKVLFPILHEQCQNTEWDEFILRWNCWTYKNYWAKK